MASSNRIFGYRGTQVLEFVRITIAADGQAPSYAMICNALGIGTKADVGKIVARLERRGVLSRVGHGRVRRIRLPSR